MTTIPATEPDNPLILGQTVHTGIEKSLEEAIREYCFSFPIITDEHINEIIKFETVIPLARAAIPPGGKFEVEIKDDDFHGFIDYLVPARTEQRLNGENQEIPDVFDLYDFKYSNNVSGYKQSGQLHEYKYFFERNNPGKKIRNMFFVFIPKVTIRQKKTETLLEFRERLKEALSGVEVKIVQIGFNPERVIEFLFGIKAVNEETEFPQEKSYLCRYCEFQEYCEKGNDYMIKLPENKRRNIEAVEKRVLWIYGVPFCGKTTFANNFPDPLMLNTDGNIKFVDAPYIRIKDEVRVEGRQTKRTLAWDVFKDTISELEKKENTFRTIVVDLLEDLYEHCRLYMYQQMGITHESDDSFRAWDKVRGEFLNTLKRLMNLDYENIILISHEDTSKDITRKGGDKITAIKPNLQEKVANKVAGMVDVVARIVADGETRTFSFKSNEVIFGGGRLRVNAKDIPLDVKALFAVYDEANKNAASGMAEPAAPAKTGRTGRKRTETPATPADKPQDSPKEEQPTTDTPEPESPQEAPETAAEQQPEKETEQPAPEAATPADGAMNPPEAPAEGEEKPRRKRKARD
ncbi:putative phage nucleotide-binding protein [[Clostridium] asparagiforme DSM 15981]|uniref:Putative phage nucleotide-binding protein n=2 Tax=Enterocloster asparagiformis TaxID=333367 RepID=C0DAK6_9FIRM|nr:putative phage nucleotide-binding protein [[Clostridium] asparagiforme DSM 15981]